MKDSPWQRRARAAGLTQRQLAVLCRRDESTVGRALSGARLNGATAGPYIAIILAWEMMTAEQREAWMRSVADAI